MILQKLVKSIKKNLQHLSKFEVYFDETESLPLKLIQPNKFKIKINFLSFSSKTK